MSDTRPVEVPEATSRVSECLTKYKNYVLKKNSPIRARKLERDEYFGNSMLVAGDYILATDSGDFYAMKQECFETLFVQRYSSLQEFIDENQNDPKVIAITEAFFAEREK